MVLTATVALGLFGLSLIPAVRTVLGVEPLELGLGIAVFLTLNFSAAFTHRRWGYESAAYRALNRAETVFTILSALYFASRQPTGLSLFWVVYFAVVGQAASFGANVRFNTVLFTAAPLTVAAVFAAEDRGAAAMLAVAITAVAMAGYRTSLMAARRVAEANAARRLVAEQLAELEVLRERERIGRDLHDGLGAELTSLVYRLQELSLEPNAHAELSQRIQDVLEELRSVVWMLRRPGRTVGELAAWLRTRLGELGAGAVKVRLDVEADEQLVLRGELAVHVVHVVLESVRNAVRHSGAQSVSARLAVDQSSVSVQVKDDGKGIATNGSAEPGGLANLRARAQSLGGTFALDSSAAGTTASFRCPLPAAEVSSASLRSA